MSERFDKPVADLFDMRRKSSPRPDSVDLTIFSDSGFITATARNFCHQPWNCAVAIFRLRKLPAGMVTIQSP
jgi:hypothetical protein